MPETGTEDDIRKRFAEWWQHSAVMDIEGTMAKIADDVVSYEHQAPLVHRGEAAVRASCQGGFDAMKQLGGAFRWTVENLEVVVRDDIAVAWGVNHMRTTKDGELTYESRSRGTWLFRKQNGRWQAIHQHFSYPCDPATGQAAMNLTA